MHYFVYFDVFNIFFILICDFLWLQRKSPKKLPKLKLRSLINCSVRLEQVNSEQKSFPPLGGGIKGGGIFVPQTTLVLLLSHAH